MEKKSIRRVVSLAVLLALLIGVMPLLKITTGLADDAKPISARVNGFPQTDGANLVDIMTKNKLNYIESVEVVSGVITEADFRDLKAKGLNSQLNLIVMKTMQVPSITDPTVFDGCPSTRSIHVLSSMVAQYRAASDGDTSDTKWYGFDIVDVAPEIMLPGDKPHVVVDSKEIIDVDLNVYAPLANQSPQDIAEVDDANKYKINQAVWSTSETGFVSGNFEADKSYKTLIELKAESGYYFSATIKPNLNNLTTYSGKNVALTPVVGAVNITSVDTTNDTLTFEVTYPPASTVDPPKKQSSSPKVMIPSVIVDLRSPIIDGNTAIAAPTIGANYKVESTSWYNNGVPMSIPEKFTAGGDFKATIVVKPNDPLDDFTGATVTVKDPNMGTQYVGTVNSTIASGSITIDITYAAAVKNITNPALNLKSPYGGRLAEVATPEPAVTPQFTVASTTWTRNDTEPIAIGSMFPDGGKYVVEIKLDAIAPNVFPPTAIPSAFDPNSGTQYRHGSPESINVAADGTSMTFKLPYAVNAGNCTHTSLKVSGPRVPIPPNYTDTTNSVEPKPDNTAELIVSKVECGSCFKDVTADCYYSWRRVNRVIPGSPYQPLTNRVMGANVYTVRNITKPDGEYDYYVNITLDGVQDGKNSDYVYLKLDDNIWIDPYFEPPVVNCYVSDNVTLSVKLDPPVPENLKYEWRAGKKPTTGAATGTILYTGYAPDFTLRNIKATDAGFYNVTVTNEKNGKSKPAQVEVKVHVAPADLIPILPKDIYTLDFKAPVTGDTPVMLKAPANANYTIEHKWRNATSIVAPPSKFAAGKSYIADVTIIPKNGYRIGNVGDAFIEIDVMNNYLSKTFKEMGENGSYCRLEVKFSTTMNPDKKDQSQLQYVTNIPERKTYGDADFAVSVRGGSGDGAITFTSSDDKVLSVKDVKGNDAVISVVGGGTATITATKAGGKDTENNYNPATVISNKITVAPKILVVKASDKTIKAGMTTEVYPVDISGFVRGDNAYSLAGFESPTAVANIPKVEETVDKTTKKKKDEPVKTPAEILAEEQAKLDKLCGKFEIVPSGGKPTSAYVFRYVTGTLTINRTGIADAPPPFENFIRDDSITIEDRKNGILLTDFSEKGIFKAGTQLCVVNETYTLTDEEKALYNANINATVKGKQLAQIYDISLKLDGTPIQPNDDVLVDIDLASNLKGRYTDLQIAYISDYGDITIMPHAVNADKITFLTDHFSKYAIIGTSRYGAGSGGGSGVNVIPGGNGSDVPQTSDANPYLMLFIGLAVISGTTIIKIKSSEKSKVDL